MIGHVFILRPMISFCHHTHDRRLTFKFDRNYHVRQNGQVRWGKGEVQGGFGSIRETVTRSWKRNGAPSRRSLKGNGEYRLVNHPDPSIEFLPLPSRSLLWSVIGCELNSIRSAVKWRFVWWFPAIKIRRRILFEGDRWQLHGCISGVRKTNRPVIRDLKLFGAISSGSARRSFFSSTRES